ncbi:hypothetical protein EPUL_003106 [Erysiphe pulchra]|uniref:EXS domain-containing protein n=1 Tax=Erysiphe pulchra TaxID=225359 RepID=A0A2S4PVU4_9PEZI|nr:hypothetical protein EPUL_003106 [Erysiphe pulchra]
MSFGHNLDRDLVPEWRIKYVDYKEGKRHIKAISRAFNRVTASSRNNGGSSPIPTRENSRIGPLHSFSNRRMQHSMFQSFEAHQGAGRLNTLNQSRISIATSPAAIDKKEKAPETSIDTKLASNFAKISTDDAVNRDRQLNDPISRDFANPHRKPSIFSQSIVESTHVTSPTGDPDDYFNHHYRMPESPKSFLSNVFSGGGRLSPAESHQTNLDIGATDILRQRQNKFFKWNNEELEKVETFYKSKEEEADKLLTLLREQLYEMRTRRIEELAEVEQINAFRRETEATVDFNARCEALKESNLSYSQKKLKGIFNPLQKSYLKLRQKFTSSHVGSNSKALQDMKPSVAARLQRKATMVGGIKDGNESFRKSHYEDNVPYRKAKKKLKLALLECYRGMEMLKSYAVINQMAFNKINRKYARVVGSSPHVRHLTERVNRSWFIRSNVLDSHIHEAIDLYARYFENGQHKIAFGKLRGSFASRADVSGNAFRNVLLGFFTALPAVWRALQCLRRYYDTRDMFPHLVNCGKYIATILFYTTLSRYRINRTNIQMIIFLVTAAITSVYVSLWDVLMDWSLLQPNAKVRFLRDVRGYRYTWWYYAAMILNPAFRFDWILYLTNIHLLGHSTKVTFLVAIAEVTRRGIWAIFRVENEHCSNVAHFKASRAPQLPYTSVTETSEEVVEKEDPVKGQGNDNPTIHVLESQRSLGSNFIRRPLTRILADAHLADFEKRRVRTDAKDSGNNTNDNNFESDSSDDDEEIEPNNQVVFDVAALLKERRRIARETMREEDVSPRFAKPGL